MDVQADLRLCCSHMAKPGFVMMLLILSQYTCTFKYHDIHPSSDLVIVFPALIDHHNVF